MDPAADAENRITFNIKENVRNFLLDEVFDKCKTTRHFDVEAGMFMMVVDEKSIAVLNSFVQYTDLMEKGIAGIERLELQRKRFPKMHSIYFISSSRESIRKMADDFEQKPDEGGVKWTRQYNFVHLIFYNGCSDEMLQYLMSFKHLLPYIINIKAIQLQFIASDETCYTLKENSLLGTLYTNDLLEEKEKKIDEISVGISTLVSSLKSFYNVQLLYSDNSRGVAKSVAQKVHDRVANMIQQQGKPVMTPAPVTFIIMDRLDDLMTPLKHDLYYNSLLMDLLNINDNLYEHEVINEKQEKTLKVSNLDETDGLWLTKRKKPFLNALTSIIDDFNVFLKSNSAAQFQSGNIENLNIEKMGEIIRNMPQYQDLLGEYTFHIAMLEKAGEHFKSRGISDQANAEAILCSGIDKDGKPKMIENAATATNPNYEYDRIRLALMMLLSSYCNPGEAAKVKKTIPDTDYFAPVAQKALAGLEKLGAPFGKCSLTKREFAKKDPENKFADLERSMSKIAETIMNLRTGNDTQGFGKMTLPAGETFPDIKFKRGALLASKMGTTSGTNSPKPIFIVCVLGGISTNEIRELRCLEDHPECMGYLTVMGGTMQVTPIGYLKELMRVVGPLPEDIEEIKKEQEKEEWLKAEFEKDKKEAEEQAKNPPKDPKLAEMTDLPKENETKKTEEKA